MLSALELNGFKSFAERTRFEFPAGITVVVGPNGSGKSNVVDAIKWVLGAQSVKALRGKEMTDVIFSGSRSRRAANAAEASLIFDNRAGIFDHDAAEIQITRRVYRSGEGEYLINRQPCRLRDIRDLLADVGMSNGAYSIIEQGKVDAVLQSSPKERRLIFEEAAGVSRFRVKREEAARRLEKVQQNLLRLADIVEELESRLKTVRSQAGRAQKYSEVSKRLELLRTHVGLEDWRKLTARIDALRGAAGADETDVSGLERELAECDARVAEVDRENDALQQSYRDLTAAESTVRERLAQCESTRSSHLARIDELELETQRLGQQLLVLTTRAGDSQQLVAETAAELEISQQQFDSGASVIAEQQQQLAAAEAALATAAQAAVQSQTELQQAERELAQVHNDEQLLEAKLQTAEGSLGRFDDELVPLAATRERHVAEQNRSAAELTTLTSELEQANQQYQRCQTELAADRAKVAALHKLVADLEGRLTGANERTVVLEELERRLEGLTSGAKEVLRQAQAAPEGPFRNVRGVVADLLHVDADSAPLIEIALGDRANYLVVTETKSLAAALAGEPGSWPGRTSFLRLDVPSPASAVDRIDLSDEPGVMGRADTFVDAEEELQPMIRRLLGRHWLVDTLATAIRVANGPGRGLNFVTAAGEAVLADGTLTVGPRQSIAGLLSRRSELRALREQIEEMERAVADAQHDREQLERRIAAAEGGLQKLAARQAAAAQAHSDARLQVASMSDKIEQLDARIASLANARAAAAGQLQELAAHRVGSAERTTLLRQRIEQFSNAIQQATEQQVQLEAEVEKLRHALTEQRVQFARSEQRLDGLRRQMEQLRRDHAERDSLLEETQLRATECQAQRVRLQQLVLDLAAESAELFARKEGFGLQLAELEQTRSLRQGDRSAAVMAADAIREQLLARQRRLQGVQLELQQLVQQRSATAERLREDYSLDLATLAAENRTVDAVADSVPADRAAIEAEIRDLKGRLQAVGPVNVEALAELEGLETRYATLAGQYEDLQSAKARLEQIVQQINAESRELFTTSVNNIRTHFQEIFRGLFAGGEADIVLEDDASGDVLEAGISIIARPPGKQPRNISLLSGGERTLTCVALLLAIFRSRPSPFCVLDEVDAALDEANIDRFVEVLKQFMQSTQFIVITHSKRTMTCSDVLYGVTMQESGVSKRVSVRFEDVSEDGHIAPSALKAA
ncbi:chromosome segregation protein SMC [Lacipirellula limnantheis]|uniref:Chromosome partition protein Smc n=1 Tax=Lacipirellula limnantheis TaxID=2528024 RepID=A0A517TUM6_9BACT|nr:chromosome segregation protein SMC [Lacipirellula limnantheis]QDT72083.1 Chromosome partition protein Smc [Lacipirellula limnantheis]